MNSHPTKDKCVLCFQMNVGQECPPNKSRFEFLPRMRKAKA